MWWRCGSRDPAPRLGRADADSGEGVLDAYVKAPLTKIVSIDQKKGYVEYGSGVRVGLRLMWGPGDDADDGFSHGADGLSRMQYGYPSSGADSVIYLPVFVEGRSWPWAMVHANMGDGEICIGVETAPMCRYTSRRLLPQRSARGAHGGDAQHWVTYADASRREVGGVGRLPPDGGFPLQPDGDFHG